MEIKEEKIIETLVKDGVIILTKKYVEIDGVRNKVGEDVRESYGNWESDRQRLIDNESNDIVSSVFAIWGDTPTIEEPSVNED